MTKLNANQLSYTIPDHSGSRFILDHFSLDINTSELCVIKGPSGSGKSTLLTCLGGLLAPTSGTVLLGETNIYALNDSKRSLFINQHIGFIFQDFQLLPELSVKDNIALPKLLHDNAFFGSSKQAIYNTINDLMDRFGIANLANDYPSTLSGGEQQRVAILRAIINKPSFLFCDEPTGNLDSENALAVRTLLKELQSEFDTSIVIVSHDTLFDDMADSIIQISDGKRID